MQDKIFEGNYGGINYTEKHFFIMLDDSPENVQIKIPVKTAILLFRDLGESLLAWSEIHNKNVIIETEIQGLLQKIIFKERRIENGIG